MRVGLAAGSIAGSVFGAWGAITMFWPVSHFIWDVGRSAAFVAFTIVLALLARREARGGASFWRTLTTPGIAFTVAASVALAIYATVTGPLANRIVQLPEYARDYSHHGYASPAAYLAVNYWELLELQVFSWAVGGVMAVGLASIVGRLAAGVDGRRAA